MTVLVVTHPRQQLLDEVHLLVIVPVGEGREAFVALFLILCGRLLLPGRVVKYSRCELQKTTGGADISILIALRFRSVRGQRTRLQCF